MKIYSSPIKWRRERVTVNSYTFPVGKQSSDYARNRVRKLYRYLREAGSSDTLSRTVIFEMMFITEVWTPEFNSKEVSK